MWNFCKYFILVLLIFCADAANFETSEVEPIVHTDCGPVQGKFEKATELYMFLGVPYAAPPVGSRRWQPPIALKSANACWNGTLSAVKFRDVCPQIFDEFRRGNENCLFLNIWTPYLPRQGERRALLPVIVNIPGGGLLGGGGSDPQNNPARLSREGFVTVTINYRLGVLGYLALSVLSKHDPRGVSGNYGFLDQILALRWIQENIANFGGDPNRVTIMGQSSGGTSVLVFLISPLARGLFHRAISMSASVIIDMPLSRAEVAHIAVVNNTRCAPFAHTNNDTLYQCLHSLSAFELVAATPIEWTGPYDFGLPVKDYQRGQLAIVDGVVIPNVLSDLLLKGPVNDVPVIFGVMNEEPDVHPNDVVLNFSSSQWKSFIKQKFASWGNEFTEELMEFYPMTSNKYLTAQQCYDDLSADVNVKCGNIDNAIRAAQRFRNPIYFYVSTQFPSHPWCVPFGSLLQSLHRRAETKTTSTYCARYAYHTWDLIAMLDSMWPFYIQWGSDIPYGKLILARFSEFARNGNITEWKPINAYSSFPHDYRIQILHVNEHFAINYKQWECSFWFLSGFYKYSWSGQ
jgi:carboxylesterase type B